MVEQRSVVLTGAPGVGKTTLLDALKDAGEIVFEEPARPILHHQKAINGPAHPDNSPLLFVRAMLEKMVSNYHKQPPGRSFWDRGLPDMVVYAQINHLDTAEFYEAADTYRHDTTVFLLEPWEEIFANDDLRTLSFDDAKRFHELLLPVYEQLGYVLITVPNTSVQERLKFITNRS